MPVSRAEDARGHAQASRGDAPVCGALTLPGDRWTTSATQPLTLHHHDAPEETHARNTTQPDAASDAERNEAQDRDEAGHEEEAPLIDLMGWPTPPYPENPIGRHHGKGAERLACGTSFNTNRTRNPICPHVAARTPAPKKATVFHRRTTVPTYC